MSDDTGDLWRAFRAHGKEKARARGAQIERVLHDEHARGALVLERVGDHYRVSAHGVTADVWPSTGMVKVMDPSARGGFLRGTTVHSVNGLLGLLEATAKLRARMKATDTAPVSAPTP